MEAGWLSFVEDPTGATVAFWQANWHGGAQRVNRPNPFCWNELATGDLEGAKQFFHDLIGWSYEENPDWPSPYFIIETDGRQNGGILEMTDDEEGIRPHWIVYFAVQNAEKTAGRLEELGGTVRYGPSDAPLRPVAVASDPQGAPFTSRNWTSRGRDSRALRGHGRTADEPTAPSLSGPSPTSRSVPDVHPRPGVAVVWCGESGTHPMTDPNSIYLRCPVGALNPRDKGVSSPMIKSPDSLTSSRSSHAQGYRSCSSLLV